MSMDKNTVARIQELRARHQGKKQTARCGFPIDTRHEQNGIGWQPGAERISTTQHEQTEPALPLHPFFLGTCGAHNTSLTKDRPNRW
jgi:hypothetical protein